MNEFMKQLLLDVFPSPSPSFDRFIAIGNEQTVHALQQLVAGQSIYIYGPSGSGKSHLTQALAYQHSDQGLYLSPYSPLSLFEQALYQEYRVLIIDDVDKLSAWQQRQVFMLFNNWREKAASEHAFTIVASGEHAPLQLELRDDLRTRLGWGLIFRLHLLSDDDKITALQEVAAQRGLSIPNEALNWLLTHYDRRLTKLIPVIEKLDAYSLERKKPITLHLLRDLFADDPIFPE